MDSPAPWLRVYRSDFALAALSGLATGIAFLSEFGGLAVWFSAVPLFVAIWRDELKLKRLLKIAFAWATPFHLCALAHAANLHSLEWRGLSYPQSLLVAYVGAWFGLSFILTLSSLVWATCLAFTRPSGGYRHIVPVFLWVLLEFLQRVIPLSVPWNTLAVTQAAFPSVIQISSITGSLGVSALIIAANNSIALALLNKKWVSAAPALVLALLNAILGKAFLSTRPVPSPGTGVSVQILQGNIEPERAWKPEAIFELLGVFQQLTEQASASHPNVILWTETALPANLRGTPMLNAALGLLARQSKATIGLGALGVENQQMQNTLEFYDPSGAPVVHYAKRRLVPFGEYTPGGAVLRPLFASVGLLAGNTLSGDLLPGATAAPLPAASLKWGPLICFETIFPDLARDSVAQGANVLVEVTNGAWFKKSAALLRHHEHGVLRAVENRRYLIRAANTGVSGAIDPYGRQLARTPICEKAIVSAEIWPVEEQTLATRLGDWFVWFSGLIVLATTVVQRRHDVQLLRKAQKTRSAQPS